MRPTAPAGTSRIAEAHRDLAAQARRLTDLRSREIRVRLTRGLVVWAAFFALLGAGWMMGGNSIVNAVGDANLLGGAKTATGGDAASKLAEAHKGQFVHELPDGVSCKFVQFDNITERVGETTKGRCEDPAYNRNNVRRNFTWGRN